MEKCKVLHCGYTNSAEHYVMKGNDEARTICTTQERDLGVFVDLGVDVAHNSKAL